MNEGLAIAAPESHRAVRCGAALDTATLFEELQTRDLASRLLGGDLSGPDALKLVLLGLPLRDGPISQVRRARELEGRDAAIAGDDERIGHRTDSFEGRGNGRTARGGRGRRRTR